jgi:exopolysaccharide production protein ExoZ
MRAIPNPLALIRLPSAPSEIVGIQCMRYVAAMAVLVDHFIVVLVENGRAPHELLPFAYRLGAAGVFVFFAISGFVMMLTNRGKFRVPGSAGEFLLRRLIRIWPMYFLATVIVFATRHGTDGGPGADDLARSLSFVPYASPNGLYRPVLGKGWTLNYEMFFYAVFAAGLLFRKPAGLFLVGLVLVALAAGEGAGSGAGEALRFYANGIVLYFLIGIVLGYLVKETRIRWVHARRAEVAVTLAIVAGAALFAVDCAAPPGWAKQAAMLSLAFACLYCVCFSGTRFGSARVGAAVSLLGDSSYCLYLFHGFLFFAVKPLLAFVSGMPAALLLALVASAATVSCVLMHLYVEAPLNRLLLGAYRKTVPATQLIPPSRLAAAGANRNRCPVPPATPESDKPTPASPASGT